MKIFIRGGIRGAVSRLIPIWEKLGHSVTKDVNEGDVQLAIIKMKGVVKFPTILRLDGIYYDKGDDYKGRNASISKAHSKADGIIYQSNLSKMMCEKYLTKRKTDICDVIYNGIDGLKWHNFKEHADINIVCCAKWRRPKRLPETIEIFKMFLKKCSKAKLHVIGQFLKCAKKIDHPNVVYYGKIDYKKMKKIYSISDIYIHLCKKDSCPSTVLEAIAAGVPVITTNACGGATEMCKLTDGCIIINGESESLGPDYIYKNEYNKMPKEVQNSIVEAMVGAVKDVRRVILPAELSAEYVARKYIKIMEKVL